DNGRQTGRTADGRLPGARCWNPEDAKLAEFLEPFELRPYREHTAVAGRPAAHGNSRELAGGCRRSGRTRLSIGEATAFLAINLGTRLGDLRTPATGREFHRLCAGAIFDLQGI